MRETTKPYKGVSMEGRIARWYTKTRANDLQDFRRRAEAVAMRLRPGADVLEVAPGPGFFSIELAKAGDFHITGLDISRGFVQIRIGKGANRRRRCRFSARKRFGDALRR